MLPPLSPSEFFLASILLFIPHSIFDEAESGTITPGDIPLLNANMYPVRPPRLPTAHHLQANDNSTTFTVSSFGVIINEAHPGKKQAVKYQFRQDPKAGTDPCFSPSSFSFIAPAEVTSKSDKKLKQTKTTNYQWFYRCSGCPEEYLSPNQMSGHSSSCAGYKALKSADGRGPKNLRHTITRSEVLIIITP